MNKEIKKLKFVKKWCSDKSGYWFEGKPSKSLNLLYIIEEDVEPIGSAISWVYENGKDEAYFGKQKNKEAAIEKCQRHFEKIVNSLLVEGNRLQ